jgi:hypothetical protein
MRGDWDMRIELKSFAVVAICINNLKTIPSPEVIT